ncbi:MAG: hypothetical protein WBV77_09565 [Solirubrobacteraceae bacterium]
MVVLVCVSLALGLVACGGSNGPTKAFSIRADGDGDNPADTDGDSTRYPPNPNGSDSDNDTDNDHATANSYDFPDEDDKLELDYGRAANSYEASLLSGIVKRYYALAAAGDAARACSQLPHGLAEEYAGVYELPYLKGSKTCQAIVSKVFAHAHKQLTEPIKVVAVRIKGNTAKVIIGSTVMPASTVTLGRRHGVWKIQEEPLGHALD